MEDPGPAQVELVSHSSGRRQSKGKKYVGVAFPVEGGFQNQSGLFHKSTASNS
jgi:hypothetical protein